MTEPLRISVDRLIRDTYRPFYEISELIRCFGEAALTVTDAPHAEIAVQSPGDETGLHVVLGGGEPRKASSSHRSFFPVLYQKAEMGRIVIPRSVPSLGDFGVRACSWIAKSLAHHLKRHEVSQLARQRQGREISFVGTSEPLSRVDHFVEQASRTLLPALIHGRPGTQLAQVALALHLAGPRGDETFLQANCATLGGEGFEERLLQLLLRADGGTLLLSRLGTLDERSQLLLCNILEIGISPWTAERLGRPLHVRLLATANRDLDAMVQRGAFSVELLAQLDFLRLEVEPLRNRREDIRPLIEFYLRRHSCGEIPEVSEEVMAFLENYDWPGNVAELSRVVARLAVMTDDGRVLPRHVHVYAPQVLEPPPAGASAMVSQPDTTDPEKADPSTDFLSRLEACHPSLRRAVDHIAANYQEKLTLSEVAARTHISGSHLAHLFQQGLGTTFTRFLTVLRLTEVKKLLLENPRESITTVAAEAGFSDFRHFERTFKSIVGCTPREFRRLSAASRKRENH